MGANRLQVHELKKVCLYVKLETFFLFCCIYNDFQQLECLIFNASEPQSIKTFSLNHWKKNAHRVAWWRHARMSLISRARVCQTEGSRLTFDLSSLIGISFCVIDASSCIPYISCNHAPMLYCKSLILSIITGEW